MSDYNIVCWFTVHLPDGPPPDAMAARGGLEEAALGPRPRGPHKGLAGIIAGLVLHSGSRARPSALGLVL